MITSTVNNKSETNLVSIDDIDHEQWLSEVIPSLPMVVCNSLRAAGAVQALWVRNYSRGGVDIYISSTFARLSAIKQILTGAGITRKRWPKPPYRCSRPGGRYFSLRTHYNPAGTALPKRYSLKLNLEQHVKLEKYAQRLCQTPRQAAQALFDSALKGV